MAAGDPFREIAKDCERYRAQVDQTRILLSAALLCFSDKTALDSFRLKLDANAPESAALSLLLQPYYIEVDLNSTTEYRIVRMRDSGMFSAPTLALSICAAAMAQHAAAAETEDSPHVG